MSRLTVKRDRPICNQRFGTQACLRPSIALGMCNTHYLRKRNNIDLNQPLQERARSGIKITPLIASVIREIYDAGGISTRALGRQFSIDRKHVARIVSGVLFIEDQSAYERVSRSHGTDKQRAQRKERCRIRRARSRDSTPANASSACYGAAHHWMLGSSYHDGEEMITDATCKKCGTQREYRSTI